MPTSFLGITGTQLIYGTTAVAMSLAFYKASSFFSFILYIFPIIFECVLVWTATTLIASKGPLDQNWKNLVHTVIHSFFFFVSVLGDITGFEFPSMLRFACKSYLTQTVVHNGSLTSYFDFPTGFNFTIFCLVAIIESTRNATVPVISMIIGTILFTFIHEMYNETVLFITTLIYYFVAYVIVPKMPLPSFIK